MFPEPSLQLGSARNPDKRKLRPIMLQTTFGNQVDSRKESPVGVIISAPVSARLAMRPATSAAFVGPSPLHYPPVPSCGPQPLSTFYTAARTPLNLKEDRWRNMERIQRLNATPAPSHYYPRC